jgi:hypothetical protein
MCNRKPIFLKMAKFAKKTNIKKKTMLVKYAKKPLCYRTHGIENVPKVPVYRL